jgi:hypothetical protein
MLRNMRNRVGCTNSSGRNVSSFTKMRDLVTHFRTALPEVVTLGRHLKQHGYYAAISYVDA